MVAKNQGPGLIMYDHGADYAVAVVGAGAAGAALALALARQGLKTALIDPRAPHERDFRAEKLTPEQWEQVRLLGLDDLLRPVLTFEPCVWIARRGRLVEKRPSGNRNFRYPAFVQALRRAVESEPLIDFFPERAAEIAPSDDLQSLILGDGRQISARLAVLATGVGAAFAKNLGFQQRPIFARHSVSIGFDCRPVGRPRFAFPALTYYPEKPSDLIAYLSLFPIESVLRANVFVYRPAEDAWLGRMKASPEQALRELMPGLGPLMGDFALGEAPAQRPVDLFRIENANRPGVVLIGDSFGTACPASGSGLDKVFSDVARLSAILPQWLATPGMGAEKIARFYADPQKRAADASSLARSRRLREMSVATDLRWRLRRDFGFLAQAARGSLRAAFHHEPGPFLGAAPRREA